MDAKFPPAVPEIPVSDIGKAAEYYEKNLGFKTDWRSEEDGIAGVSKGHCRMFLANSSFRERYGNAGPVLIWLNVDSRDEVNQLYEQWKGAQARIVSTPEAKPWDLFEFTAADLDGNLFRVFHDFSRET